MTTLSKQFIDTVRRIIVDAQQQAFHAVNQERVLMY